MKHLRLMGMILSEAGAFGAGAFLSVSYALLSVFSATKQPSMSDLKPAMSYV